MIATIKRTFRLGVAIVLLATCWLGYYAFTAAQLPRTPLEFSIARGSSLKSVAFQLSDAGILREPWSFVALGRLAGKAGAIKAGDYELTSNMSPWRLLQQITSGDYTLDEIVFVEGVTFKQMRKVLNEHTAIRHDTAAMSDPEVLRALGATENAAEGLFFPDTYMFSKNTSDLEILRRAYANMQQRLSALWPKRAQDVPLADPYQALILASIVEKETGKAADRGMIAGVLGNRLRLNMKLQADPTVIYGLGDNFDGNLRRRDLQADTPYNTYLRNGLPPTPIAMPGYASIYATLHPERTTALYYVSRGDGASHFSDSLAEHNRAVTKYQKLPNQVR